jgi:hypothetical protein
MSSRALEPSDTPVTEPIGPLPDRVTIWPIEDGTFGVDATFQGVTGYQHAELHEQVLKLREVRCTLRQELDGGWTIRLGRAEARPAAVAQSRRVTTR